MPSFFNISKFSSMVSELKFKPRIETDGFKTKFKDTKLFLFCFMK